MTTHRDESILPWLVSANAAVRLQVPTLPPTCVSRPRLTARLDAAGSEGILAVHGPAGCGKTSLVASWVSGLTRPVSWYTIDTRDQVPMEFWTNLTAAIGRLRPNRLGEFAALLRSDLTSSSATDELINALASAPGDPVTLVLDDVQLIAEHPDLFGVVRDLVRYQPQGLQLVLISRSTAALPLDRARIEGRLTLIDFDDLRFSPAEAAELLGNLMPGVPAAWVDGTIERVDGWAAGLQLLVIANRSSIECRDDRRSPEVSPAGSQITTDYLLDAFRSEPAELVQMLRQISIVDRVNVPLTRAISGREDAERLLRTAHDRDLFITRRGRGWYEIHSLVRETLRDQLADEDPEYLRELHARAAQRLEADHDFVAALDHWARAGRHGECIRLLSDVHLLLYDAGRHDVVRRVIQTIPIDAYATDFAATMAFTWCQVLVDRTRFLDGVARLSWWAQRSPVAGVLAARLALLQSVAATVGGDWVTGGRLARQAMDDLGPDWILDSYGRFGFNMVARDVAMSETWHDQHPDVRRSDLELAQDPIRRLSFEGIRALGEALAGEPLAALQTASGVRTAADVTNMAILGDELRLAEMVARREIGDVAGLLDEIETLTGSEVAPTTYVKVRALAELVAFHLDADALDSAVAALDQLQMLVDGSIAGRGARTLLARAAFDVALASDSLEDADRWILEIDDTFWNPVDRARALLRRSDSRGALNALSDAVARCARHDVILALLRAVATPEHEAALKHATAAVEAAVDHGMVRTIAAQGRDAIELVERCAWRAPVGWLDRVRRASVTGHVTGRVIQQGLGSARMIDELTQREHDVLRFLPSRLTLQEIADELYISMNTLKFHLKVIYRKLGVGSRAEAAGLARQIPQHRPS